MSGSREEAEGRSGAACYTMCLGWVLLAAPPGMWFETLCLYPGLVSRIVPAEPRWGGP